MDAFDVIVVGGGPAGATVAGRCADGGLTVAWSSRKSSAPSAPTGLHPEQDADQAG